MTRPVQLMIVGAQKAGTTSLLRYLGQHPEIQASRHVEMSYFAGEYGLGYERAFKKYFPGYDGKKLLLAKHALCMHWPDAPVRLHRHNPEAQIVALLRDPVKRAYSAYWFARRRGRESLRSFEEAIEAEPRRLKEGWHKWRECAYLYNSTYYEPVERLFELFGRERVHVFLTDDLKRNPIELCGKIFSLFDIDRTFSPRVEERHNSGAMARSEAFARAIAAFLRSEGPLRKMASLMIPAALRWRLRSDLQRANTKPATPPPLREDTRRRLVEYFLPHNRKLEALIGRDLSCWDS